jgi:molecular chaperone DnaK
MPDPSISRIRGVLRFRSTNDADFADFIDKHVLPAGLAIPHPTPPAPGTEIRLEVMTRDTGERICTVDVVVSGVLSDAEPFAPAMVVSLVNIEPGCGEEVRRALRRIPRIGREVPRAAGSGMHRAGSGMHRAGSGMHKAGSGMHRATGKPGRVIGIDLGTTFACAAVVEGGEPRVIQSRLGYSTIPSVLTFDDQGLPVVGHLAERRLVLEPDCVVYGSKRLMGRTFSPSLAESFQARTSCTVVSDADGMAAIRLRNRTLSPIEVGACILAEVRRMAEGTLREPVTRAVVTVPAAFTENQRAAVREAGVRANLEILRIVNEPTAATLAFGYGRGIRKTVLVYDLGGGTFDVSILSLDGNVSTVLATVGDTFLGGMDFDDLLADILSKSLQKRFGDVHLDRRSKERLRGAAREMKHALSEMQRTTFALPRLQIGDDAAKMVDFSATLTRDQFEAAAIPLIERTIKICEKALTMAKLDLRQIDDVLLVGGQTRMPAIARRLQTFFNRPPSKRVHPDEAVALGAAILATTFERPDAPTLKDILSLPIGIGLPDGMMRPVLAAKSSLPAKATFAVDVPADGQIEIAVFQGESMKASDNEFLGSFTHDVEPDGKSPAAGNEKRRVELTFLLDVESILTIQSKNLSTGKEVTHALTTRQTSDEVLARLGRERLAVRGVAPAGGTSATSPDGASIRKASGTHKGFWTKLVGGSDG